VPPVDGVTSIPRGRDLGIVASRLRQVVTALAHALFRSHRADVKGKIMFDGPFLKMDDDEVPRIRATTSR